MPVLIDPGMGKTNLLGCIEEAEPEAFIAIPLAHAARVLRPHAFRTVKAAVTVGRRWFWGGPTLAQFAKRPGGHSPVRPRRRTTPPRSCSPSGSTGAPKGVVYEHGMFDAQVRELRDYYGIRRRRVDLPAFPLFALFSVAMGVTSSSPTWTRPSRPGWTRRSSSEAIQRPSVHAVLRLAGHLETGSAVLRGAET